jgi:hypothetical protein
MFFSVRLPIKLNGKVFKPCICYECPEDLEKTVRKLEREGKAFIYDHRAFFQNGKILVKSEVEPEHTETVKASKSRKRRDEEIEDLR